MFEDIVAKLKTKKNVFGVNIPLYVIVVVVAVIAIVVVKKIRG